MVYRLILILLIAVISVVPNYAADYDKEAELALILAKSRPYSPRLPATAERYPAALYTQAIFRFTGDPTPVIRPITIKSMPESKWHQPGGLEGVDGWLVEKFRTLPSEPVEKLVTIQVKNSDGNFQPETGLSRTYPNESRFDEVLLNEKTGLVFEHRVRSKTKGEWNSETIFESVKDRPTGYTGLKVACASCHDETGTGGYGVGLTPGGDGVFSDPLPWHLSKQSPEPNTYKATESKLFTPEASCSPLSFSSQQSVPNPVTVSTKTSLQSTPVPVTARSVNADQTSQGSLLTESQTTTQMQRQPSQSLRRSFARR